MSREIHKNLDKSLSDSETKADKGTPPNKYVSIRSKRKREDDISQEFDKFKEEMRCMMMSLFDKHNNELKQSLKEIKETNSNIKDSVDFLSAQIEELKGRIHRLEEEKREDKKHITFLEERLENVQLDIRKSNFEIKNAPKKPKENKEDLINMTLQLSSTIGSQLKREDIKDIFRVPSKPNGSQNTPIVVETSSVMVKSEVLRQCKAFSVIQKTKLRAKHLGWRVQEETPIFVNEQLTGKAARLFFLARDLVKSHHYKFCWTSMGRVYVRKNEENESPYIHIKSEKQIQDLMKNK